MDKAEVEGIFSCYDTEVETKVKNILPEETEETLG